jgi:Tfp pilus assembly protein PilV
MRRRYATQRGATLLEIMISLAVILVGLLGLFKVLGAAVSGSQSARRITNGTERARHVMEAIRTMPNEILGCLVTNPATGWAACETLCTQKLGPKTAAQTCVFTTLSNAGVDKDRVNQSYRVVYDAGDASRSSFVKTMGASGRVYDIQITIGWNDDGTATKKNGGPPDHRVTVHSAVLR